MARHVFWRSAAKASSRASTPSYMFTNSVSAETGVINAAHAVKFTSHFELKSVEVNCVIAAFDRVCANCKH
jgi:hypothetical protein